MIVAAAMPFTAAADSARGVAAVYTVSLLAFVPTVLAGITLLLVKHGEAQARVLVWRSALAALGIVFVGRLLPLHWIAWVMPSTLAAPLIELGRAQLTSTSSVGSSGTSWSLLDGLLAIYGGGVLVVLLRTVVATFRVRRIARRAQTADAECIALLRDVCGILDIRRRVRLLMSDDVRVPMTWGLVCPTVVLPSSAQTWRREQQRMVLLHETAHIRAGDWTVKLLARLVCAAYWFHPGVWWLARGLDEDCERACDDRVIHTGARRSDYAELLVIAADRLLPAAALALSSSRGLRARLRSVLDVHHDVRPLARRWTLVAASATLAVAAPVSAVQLAPTRDVLTSLMRDARWESRAYAVIGLASRADSVAVARAAAERDPSPRVRAWARYALNLRGEVAPATSPFHR